MKKLTLILIILFHTTFIFAQLSQILPESFAYEHVYQIKNPLNNETCSSIKVSSEDGKLTYLITARHLFNDNNLTEGKRTDLLLLHEEKWKSLMGAIHFHPNKDVDMVAIEIPFAPSSKNNFEIGTAGLLLGQETFFLGFPFGFNAKGSGDLNRGFNIPWIKYAHVSSIYNDNGVVKVFLDGINNPGFSGGPVFAKIDSKLTLVGIVSGYVASNLEIKYKDQSVVLPENSGIIITCSSMYINELINKK